MCQKPKRVVIVDDSKHCYNSLSDYWKETASHPLTQDEAMEVIAYHPDWIDLDFNPNGTRVGFIGGEGNFISAKWLDYQDTYINGEDINEPNPVMPTYYMYMPYRPRPELFDMGVFFNDK